MTYLLIFLSLVMCQPAFADVVLPKPVLDNDYRSVTPAAVKLGRLLFYDRVLSGTYRVSCATCHNHDRASSNGFLLPGKKALEQDDLAVNGLPVYEALKPSARHAPALFNLGAKEFQSLFSDGRVSRAHDGYLSPSEELPDGLKDVLAVQSLFPAVTGDELVGTDGNDVSNLSHHGDRAIWAALADRIRDLPDYFPHFEAAYPEIRKPEDISIIHVANAISAFVGFEWRADGSPFDRYLRGDKTALNNQQLAGMKLFYGELGCGSCHSGVFQTDHKYHRVNFPPWRFDAMLSEAQTSHFDDRLGRIEVTGNAADLYAFRTPSLRNVSQTAPYGYSGSFETLALALKYHLAPRSGLKEFVSSRSGEGGEVTLQNQVRLRKVRVDFNSPDRRLGSKTLNLLIAFLESLEDKKSLSGRLGKPTDVPSSLVVD